MEKLGIQETKDCLDLVLDLFGMGKEMAADGKLSVTDLGILVTKAPMLTMAAVKAFEGVKEIPAELSELSEQEAAELVAHVSAKVLPDTSDKAKLIAEKAFKVVIAAYGLVVALKSSPVVAAPQA